MTTHMAAPTDQTTNWKDCDDTTVADEGIPSSPLLQNQSPPSKNNHPSYSAVDNQSISLPTTPSTKSCRLLQSKQSAFHKLDPVVLDSREQNSTSCKIPAESTCSSNNAKSSGKRDSFESADSAQINKIESRKPTPTSYSCAEVEYEYQNPVLGKAASANIGQAQQQASGPMQGILTQKLSVTYEMSLREYQNLAKPRPVGSSPKPILVSKFRERSLGISEQCDRKKVSFSANNVWFLYPSHKNQGNSTLA